MEVEVIVKRAILTSYVVSGLSSLYLSVTAHAPHRTQWSAV